MRWFKKFLTALFSLILVISLVGLSLATSFNLSFSSPSKLNNWVNQSNFYTSLISKGVSDTAKTLDYTNLNSQLDPIINQALKGAFPEPEFNHDTSTIISSNYNWLKGRSTKPNFKINLSSQKTIFATEIGNYVKARYQTLPVCTFMDLENLHDTNPLTIACQIPTLSAEAIKDRIVGDIESSNIIINNSNLTANNLASQNGKPYYKKANAPRFYQRLHHAPIALTVISLISMAIIVFLSSRKRRALTKISISFTVAGLILIAMKLSTNKFDTAINKRIAKNSSLTNYQEPISSLVHKIVGYINSINLWFGVVYLILALLLSVLVVRKHRHIRRIKKLKISDKDDPVKDLQPNPGSGIASLRQAAVNRPSLENISSGDLRPKVQPTAPEISSKTTLNKEKGRT